MHVVIIGHFNAESSIFDYEYEPIATRSSALKLESESLA